MPKKEKSKARLDKYYYLAKEHGYRSRAAFKLIQLNQKYDFLNKAVCVVDLCAAPGGWLQVANKYMPLNSVKVGVDLVPIKNITGCVSLQADITAPKCLTMIKREIKHVKADVVLHDGAPNVGAEWTKDAYTQSELVLSALKMATQLLRSGGTFVTKIFRSKDYATLISVLKKLFRKVDATKPKASRATSAEIFVVCTGYTAPKVVEPQLLDPKVVFNDSGLDSKDVVSSLKQLLEQKKHRSGYAEGDKGFVYEKTKLTDFVNSVNPFQTLKRATELVIDEQAKQWISKVATPDEITSICKDVKVIGKREISILLKWRTKLLHTLAKEKKKEEEAAMGEEVKAEKIEKVPNEEEEIDAFIAMRDKKALKGKKKMEQRIARQKIKRRGGEFAGEDNIDEDMGFDELLDHPDEIDEIGCISLSDTDNEIENQGFSCEPVEEAEMGSDEDEVRIEKMNKEFEEQHKKQNEEGMLKRRVKQRGKKLGEGEDEGEEMEDVADDGYHSDGSAGVAGDKEEVFVNPLKSKINAIVEDKEGAPTEETRKKNKRKRAYPEKKVEEADDIPAVEKVKSERDLRKDKMRKQRERLEDSGKIGKRTGFEEVAQENFEGMLVSNTK